MPPKLQMLLLRILSVVQSVSRWLFILFNSVNRMTRSQSSCLVYPFVDYINYSGIDCDEKDGVCNANTVGTVFNTKFLQESQMYKGRIRTESRLTYEKTTYSRMTSIIYIWDENFNVRLRKNVFWKVIEIKDGNENVETQTITRPSLLYLLVIFY